MMGQLRKVLRMPAKTRPPKPEPEVATLMNERNNPVRRIVIRQGSLTPFPELYMPIYVHGTKTEQKRFAEMFVRSYCYKVSKPKDADLVIFAGSADVDPELYGEEPHDRTERPNPDEDISGIKLFKYCRRHGIPMMGVCKGAQLLHVCMGGKLYQHIDNHFGDHSMHDLVNNAIVQRVSSLHHQSCIPQKGMRVLAKTARSTEKWRNPNTNDGKLGIEVEAFYYQKAGIIGFQGHPEYRGYDHYAAWCLQMIEQLIIYGEEYHSTNEHLRRLSSELVATRKEDPKICVD